MECECIICRKGEVGATVEIARTIDEYGLAVVPVIGTQPQLTFTIGLLHSYRHPELIVFGIAARQAQIILNACAFYIKEHGKLRTNVPYDDFANLPTIFRPANPTRVEPHIFRCTDFYGMQPPVLQLVWPDPAGVFPWEPSFDQKFERHQPRLWEGSKPQVVKS